MQLAQFTVHKPAANEEWLGDIGDRTVPAPRRIERPRGEEGQIHRCLGAAVIMRWTTLPTNA
jgi:hypothetical protein